MIKHLFESEQQPKFKVGDKVTALKYPNTAIAGVVIKIRETQFSRLKNEPIYMIEYYNFLGERITSECWESELEYSDKETYNRYKNLNKLYGDKK